MAVVSNTIYVNSDFEDGNCSVLFDALHPFGSIESALVAWNMYISGNYRELGTEGDCVKKPSGTPDVRGPQSSSSGLLKVQPLLKAPESEQRSSTDDEVGSLRTVTIVISDSGVHDLFLNLSEKDLRSNIIISGNGQYPQPVVRLRVPNRDSTGNPQSIIIPYLTFEDISVTIDLRDLTLEEYEAANVPVLLVRNLLRFGPESYFSYSNVRTTEEVSSQFARDQTLRASLQGGRDKPKVARIRPVTIGPTLPTAVLIQVSAEALLDIDNVSQFEIRRIYATIIENNGRTDVAFPDVLMDQGKIIVNRGILRIHPRPADLSQVAWVTIGRPDGSALVYTENYNVLALESRIDIRTNFASSGFVSGFSVDPRNGLPQDPRTKQWFLPRTSQWVDPTTGRTLNPNTGVPEGPILVDPRTGRLVVPEGSPLYIFETPTYIEGQRGDSAELPPSLVTTPENAWLFPPPRTNIETPCLYMITCSDCEFRNIGSCPRSGVFIDAFDSVAFCNTDSYILNRTNLVGTRVTGQNLRSNTGGPLRITEGYGSLVTNGSTFELSRTITVDYVHTREDGTYFYVDPQGSEKCHKLSKSRKLTIVIPGEVEWNGRILKYTNIAERRNVIVILKTKRHFHGGRGLGKKMELPPGASVTLKNRNGVYWVDSLFVAPTGDC